MAKSSLLAEQRLLATNHLWQAVIAIRSAVPAVFVYLDVALQSELPLVRERYAVDIGAVDSGAFARGVLGPPDPIAKYRPLIDEHLWNVVQAYRTFICRVCAITFNEKPRNRPVIGDGRPWYQDARCMELLGQVIGADGVNQVMARSAARFSTACEVAQSRIASAIRESHERGALNLATGVARTQVQRLPQKSMKQLQHTLQRSRRPQPMSPTKSTREVGCLTLHRDDFPERNSTVG